MHVHSLFQPGTKLRRSATRRTKFHADSEFLKKLSRTTGPTGISHGLQQSSWTTNSPLCVLVPNTRAHFAHRLMNRSIIMHSSIAHLGVILILKLQWTQAPTGICLSMSRNSCRQSSIIATRAQHSVHSTTTFFVNRHKK